MLQRFLILFLANHKERAMRARTCGNLDGEACPYMEYDSGCPMHPHNHFDTEACRPMEKVIKLQEKISKLKEERKRLLQIEGAAKLLLEICPHQPKERLCVVCEAAKQILRGEGPDGKKVEVKIEEDY